MSTLVYDGPMTLRANQLFHATLTVLLDEPVEAGGSIVLGVRHVSDLADAQDCRPEAEGFVGVRSSRKGTRLRLSSANCWPRHPWNRGMDLTVEHGRLLSGDRVAVTLGGSRGFRCQSFAERAFRFRLGVRPTGDARWRVSPLDVLPAIRVTGNDAALLRLTVPNPNARAPAGRVCLKVEDAYGNVAACGEAELDLLVDDEEPIGTVRVAGMRELLDVPLPRDAAWHRLSAASRDGHFFARSNPFGPSLLEGHHLFWGEIHCQSELCDGTGSPAELYRHARQAGGLDFASVTSHDMELSPADWQEVQRATRQAHEPGRFVTFLGYEWSGATERGGDNNIYFLGDEGPLVYNGAFIADDLVPVWGDWCSGSRHASGRKRTLTETIQEIRGANVPFLVVPHCGGRIANFDFYGSAVMPVFEIHSCHRNYEDIALQTVRRGLPFGFIGGSDDHRGLLGDSVPAARERYFSSHCGLAGVYAPDLTRASLWDAIHARRVFATNGCRMALLLRAGSVLMGGELTVPAGSGVRLDFEVVLDGYLDHVELVAGTETIARFSRNANQIARYADGCDVTVPRGCTPYYLRVFQTDGGMAWSSPIRIVGV